MATQHPDNAMAPYWDRAEPKRPLIRTYQEITEAVACFQDFGVEEYMWDWEGKHADAAVIDRLFSDYHDYFSEHQLGRDKFLTFRVPNIWEEKGYSLLQAMTAILTSEDFARDLKVHERPLFEIILPMTERADQLMHMHKLFEKLARFKSSEFTIDQAANSDHIELIPLVESVESQRTVDQLLAEYVALHKQHFQHKPEYLRVFLACSDSALSSGLLAGILGNKMALSRLAQFSQQSGLPIYPITGSGSLPFRGGLSPRTVDRFIQEFPGVRTVTVQSAFRYDYPMDEVKAAIQKLHGTLPQAQLRVIDEAVQQVLTDISDKSAELYKTTLNAIAADMQPFFKAVPKRRDRRQHIGLLAYSRSMGEQTLPRAITFTGGFYSVGVPPELIGFGRTLEQLSDTELTTLHENWPNMTQDIEMAGRFLHKENLAYLAERNAAWQDVQADVVAAERILGVQFGPQTEDEIDHAELAAQSVHLSDKDQLMALITEMGVLRRSIG